MATWTPTKPRPDPIRAAPRASPRTSTAITSATSTIPTMTTTGSPTSAISSRTTRRTAPAVGHVGAIFFGPNEDNYARVGIVGEPDGTASAQVAIEQGGAFVDWARFNLGVPSPTAIANLDLFLVGHPSNHTIDVYFDV